MTANHTAQPCIWPRTSSRSSPSPSGLRERGFSAPAIHHADLDAGFLITEDFGSAGFIEGDPPAPIAERYEAATDMLAALHREPLPEILPLAPQITYTMPTFDTEALLVEAGLDARMVSAGPRRRTGGDDMRAEFVAHVARSAGQACGSRQDLGVAGFSFPQSDLARRTAGIAKVGIIDFQDAVLGPAAYDLVSLLQDARIDVPEQLELALLTRYIKARRALRRRPSIPPGFAELYAIMSAQRNTRLLGTFARLNRRDGKPQYLRHQPRIWTYLRAFAGSPCARARPGVVLRQRSPAAFRNLPVVSQPRP